MTGAATDERHGRDSATTEAVQQQGTGGSDRHHWPPVVPSADIAAYPLQGRPPGRRAADKATVGSTSAAYGRGSKSAGPCQWKTRALYAFLAGLLAVVIINLTLTLWFIRVTKFTTVRKRALVIQNDSSDLKCLYYFIFLGLEQYVIH